MRWFTRTTWALGVLSRARGARRGAASSREICSGSTGEGQVEPLGRGGRDRAGRAERIRPRNQSFSRFATRCGISWLGRARELVAAGGRTAPVRTPRRDELARALAEVERKVAESEKAAAGARPVFNAPTVGAEAPFRSTSAMVRTADELASSDPYARAAAATWLDLWSAHDQVPATELHSKLEILLGADVALDLLDLCPRLPGDRVSVSDFSAAVQNLAAAHFPASDLEGRGTVH